LFRVADITADAFINWRKQQTHGPRTLNHYLQGMISFLNWLERGERIKFNPLKNVGNGMPDNFVRKQMRHKTIRHTDGYTDEMQLPIYDAMKNLPRLDAVPGYTQIRAQNLGGKGQTSTQPDANYGGSNTHKTLVNKGGSHCLAESVAACQMERVKGIEPSAETSQVAKNQSVPTSAEDTYTQGRAQIQDSSCGDLAQVVGAWSSLSQPLKAAILAIVGVAKNGGAQ
jgi:hypothetical protein